MFISECHNTTTHNSVLVSTLGKMNNLPEYWYIHMWKQTSIAPHTIYYYFVIFSALNHSFARLFIRYMYMYINTSKPTSVAVKESITRWSFFYKKKIEWMRMCTLFLYWIVLMHWICQTAIERMIIYGKKRINSCWWQ